MSAYGHSKAFVINSLHLPKRSKRMVMVLRYGCTALVIAVLSLLVMALFVFATPAAAQFNNSGQAIGCSIMLCAGHCLDTPQGPQCMPQRPSCAVTLCAQDSRCVDTPSGAKCIPVHAQPSHPQTPSNPRTPQTPWTPWPKPPLPEGEQIACPRIYDPVCAQKQVQCVTAPCPPERRTFSLSLIHI